MHKLTGDRDAVIKVMKETIHHLSQDKPKTKRAGMKTLGAKSASQWPNMRDEVVDNLQKAYRRAQDETLTQTAMGSKKALTRDKWYAPRDQTIALLQSAMDEYLEMKAAKAQRAAKKAGSKPQSKEAVIGEQFDTLDPGWIEVAVETLKIKFKGKHKFITHKKPEDFRFPLADKATIALVGDWGGGNDAAKAVADLVKSKNPNHVIHLGDVYYAGTEKEVKNRFLKYWKFWSEPAVAGRSLALNSNHEMYSGGYAYFDVTLKEFKQPASYFSLGNDNWRFIGLDTGYVDHNLNKEQVDWLKAQLESGSPKNILLTHHQLFSAYEDTGDALETWVKPFLDAGKIYGWLWGHEHLEIIYKKFKNVKARCVGNGCFPYDVPSGAPKHPEVPIEFINRRKQPGLFSHGMHSFAVLTIDGPNLHIDYIDQDGVVAFQEDF